MNDSFDSVECCFDIVAVFGNNVAGFGNNVEQNVEMSKQIEHVQFVSTLSKGQNFTIESFDTVVVCGNKVECCFDNVTSVDGAYDGALLTYISHCCRKSVAVRSSVESNVTAVRRVNSLRASNAHSLYLPVRLSPLSRPVFSIIPVQFAPHEAFSMHGHVAASAATERKFVRQKDELFSSLGEHFDIINNQLFSLFAGRIHFR